MSSAATHAAKWRSAFALPGVALALTPFSLLKDLLWTRSSSAVGVPITKGKLGGISSEELASLLRANNAFQRMRR
jgi:hypothetical protein